MALKPVKIPTAWSYSKLKNYESCPRRHYEIDIAKSIVEPESEQLRWGNAVHKAIAAYVMHDTAFPTGMEYLAEIVEPYMQLENMGTLAECQFAMTRDGKPDEWFGRNVWVRSIVDLLKFNFDTGYARAVDWKTGKLTEDNPQLALTATILFAHYPKLHTIDTEFVFLASRQTVPKRFERKDLPGIWADLYPRVRALLTAYAERNFPAKPGFLCRNWCPVTSCEHHGG